jgi:hypothetical protein
MDVKSTKQIRMAQALGYAWGRHDESEEARKVNSADFAVWYTATAPEITGPLQTAWNVYQEQARTPV